MIISNIRLLLMLLVDMFDFCNYQILILLGLNIFCLLFGFSALLANSVGAAELVPLNTIQQVNLVSLKTPNKDRKPTEGVTQK